MNITEAMHQIANIVTTDCPGFDRKVTITYDRRKPDQLKLAAEYLNDVARQAIEAAINEASSRIPN